MRGIERELELEDERVWVDELGERRKVELLKQELRGEVGVGAKKDGSARML